MFEFITTIFSKTVSVVASAIMAIWIVSTPAPEANLTPIPEPVNEIVEETKEVSDSVIPVLENLPSMPREEKDAPLEVKAAPQVQQPSERKKHV